MTIVFERNENIYVIARTPACQPEICVRTLTMGFETMIAQRVYCYRITNRLGITGELWAREYASVEAAGAAIADALGWPGFAPSEWFEDDGEEVCCVYGTEVERDAAGDGASAARIERTR